MIAISPEKVPASFGAVDVAPHGLVLLASGRPQGGQAGDHVLTGVEEDDATESFLLVALQAAHHLPLPVAVAVPRAVSCAHLPAQAQLSIKPQMRELRLRMHLSELQIHPSPECHLALVMATGPSNTTSLSLSVAFFFLLQSSANLDATGAVILSLSVNTTCCWNRFRGSSVEELTARRNGWLTS